MTTELTKAVQQALREVHMLILPVPAPEVSTLDLAKVVSERATKIAMLLTAALTQRPAAQEVHPLASRCYAMSEPHLSGYRLVLGFETLEAVDAAHTWVANVRKATQQATPEPVGEPLFWYRPRSDGGYEGPLHDSSIEDVRKRSGAWMPLYTRPAPGVPDGFDVQAHVATGGGHEYPLITVCDTSTQVGEDVFPDENPVIYGLLSALLAAAQAKGGV